MNTRKIPLRKCTGCGEMRPKKEMLRIVRTTEGEFETDLTGKKNGRGAYICRDRACLELAAKNKGLERSFKMTIPKEIYEKLKGDEAFEKG
ncbi:MAG: YlxR family protein [Lachnospiraceae bacterium]|nr:YlxR family protein [Lachnospiraceae bacterium]